MASRSTRRRLKNSDIPKLEECENEEEANDEKQSSVGKRRSLRHSPGSSYTSPPRKTRKVKDCSNLPESSSLKTLYSPSKTSVSSQISTSPEESLKDGKTDIDSVTPVRSSRSNQIPSSPSKISVTNKSSLSSDTTKLSTKVLNTSDVAGTSKMSTPSKNSPKKESGVKSLNTPRRTDVECSDSISMQDKGLHLSTAKTPKSSTLTSEDTHAVEAANGTQRSTRHSKRKCQSPEVVAQVAANGKSHTDDLMFFKEKKLKVEDVVEIEPSASTTKTSPTVLHSLAENSVHSNGKCADKDFGAVQQSTSTLTSPSTSTNENLVACKRKLNDSPEIVEAKKRSKYEESNIQPTTSQENINKLVESEKPSNSSCITSNDELPKQSISICNESSNVDSLTNSEILLAKDFDLTESQCKEICNILPSELRDSENIAGLVEELVRKLLTEASSITSMSSPRFNKFLRQLLIKYCNSDTSVERKHTLCESAYEWSKERKSVNLRHELELALMTLYYDTGFYRKAEETANGLYKETKKLQDKEKTVKACLCLSKAYHAMGNISKARANITTAKTEALKIYTPPDLQAELDLQSGIMQVAEEKDMETAFSYFKEAATGFVCKSNRSRALKYMLLTKLLVNRPEEGEKAVRSQSHVEDIDAGVEAMLCITKAAVSASLNDFKKAREQYGAELEDDLVVKGVLDQLYSKMLEKNLMNIISPYERMQISVVSDKIGLERKEVERRLSQLILDGEISAQLDHRDDCLYVYRAEEKDTVYDHALDTVTQLDKTLSHLNRRVKQLL